MRVLFLKKLGQMMVTDRKTDEVDLEALARLRSMSISDVSSQNGILLCIKIVHLTKSGCLRALKDVPERS